MQEMAFEIIEVFAQDDAWDVYGAVIDSGDAAEAIQAYGSPLGLANALAHADCPFAPLAALALWRLARDYAEGRLVD